LSIGTGAEDSRPAIDTVIKPAMSVLRSTSLAIIYQVRHT